MTDRLISQRDENCVMRAISTACAVVGIEQPSLPPPVSFHGNEWCIGQLTRCIPDRRIMVWCESGTLGAQNAQVDYRGSSFYAAGDPRTTFDDGEFLVLYAFSMTGMDIAHMTVGYPPFGYPSFVLRLVAAIPLRSATPDDLTIHAHSL